MTENEWTDMTEKKWAELRRRSGARVLGTPEIALKALDALAVALADHGHIWTSAERGLYERAVAGLKEEYTGA